jgi:sugar phosphate permease
MVNREGVILINTKIAEWNRRRWLIWAPLALAFLTPYFHRTATGVVADSLMRDFSLGASELGGLSSVYFYTYAAMQIPAGILADRFGPRRLITFALTVGTLGAFLFAVADSMAGLYLGRFLSSFGVGLIYVGIVKIYAEWFRLREFGGMIGLLVVAGSSGFLLSATPLAYVVDTLGWRAAFLIIAAYSLVMAVVCWLVVRDKPAQLGLPTIAEIEAGEGRAAQLDVTERLSIRASLRCVLQNTQTWVPFLASVAIYGVYMAFMGVWGVPYLMQIYGMSRVAAANYIMAVAFGTMIGGPLIGVVSDRCGQRRGPYIWSTVFFIAIWLVLTLWNGAKPPVWALYPLCFAIGLGMSGVNLTVACVKEINLPQCTGVAAGVANAGAFVGAALLQPTFGWVLDMNWNGIMENGVRVYNLQAYQTAFWFCAAVLVVGLVFTLLIKERH